MQTVSHVPDTIVENHLALITASNCRRPLFLPVLHRPPFLPQQNSCPKDQDSAENHQGPYARAAGERKNNTWIIPDSDLSRILFLAGYPVLISCIIYISVAHLLHCRDMVYSYRDPDSTLRLKIAIGCLCLNETVFSRFLLSKRKNSIGAGGSADNDPVFLNRRLGIIIIIIGFIKDK